jgi:hypothetical protein
MAEKPQQQNLPADTITSLQEEVKHFRTIKKQVTKERDLYETKLYALCLVLAEIVGDRNFYEKKLDKISEVIGVPFGERQRADEQEPYEILEEVCEELMESVKRQNNRELGCREYLETLKVKLVTSRVDQEEAGIEARS